MPTRTLPMVLAVVSLVALNQMGCKWRNKQSEANANATDANAATAPADGTSPAPLTQQQTDSRALVEQGLELYRQDKDQEAADLFQKAASLDPDNGEAHLRLGLTLAALGKRDEAEAEYKRAAEAYKKYLRTNQKDAEAFFNMGLAYSRLGDHAEAVKAFRQAVKLQPEDSDMFYELGISLSRLAQYQEAVIALQKSIDLDPDNFRATEALEKAKEGAERVKVLQKRQEEQLRRADAARRGTNGNTNANTPKAPAQPTPSP